MSVDFHHEHVCPGCSIRTGECHCRSYHPVEWRLCRKCNKAKAREAAEIAPPDDEDYEDPPMDQSASKHIRLLLSDAPYAFRSLRLQWADVVMFVAGFLLGCSVWNSILS